jgi:hypothetical protein
MTMDAFERCKHFNVASIRGIAYMPGPTDYTKTKGAQYFDSDFYNGDFMQLWETFSNAGRGDLSRFKTKLGINFIHCYDWSAPVPVKIDDKNVTLRDHTVFLKACESHGMRATIPISNYTMQLLSQGKTSEAETNFKRIYDEIYSGQFIRNRGPGMWKIFNEYNLNHDRDAKHVVTVMAWIVEFEDRAGVADENRLPIMVDTSFGIEDGIAGAGYIRPVWQEVQRRGKIGRYTSEEFWTTRFVFATNPQNDGPFIVNYLRNSLDEYWNKCGIPIPPVMFTELGSSIEQTGSEQKQAEWLKAQIDASEPGVNHPMMLGACVFLNEERPWEAGAERTFGIMRFGDDNDWGQPKSNYVATTRYPQWNEDGHPYAATGRYPVEQQGPKANYKIVANAWGPKMS